MKATPAILPFVASLLLIFCLISSASLSILVRFLDKRDATRFIGSGGSPHLSCAHGMSLSSCDEESARKRARLISVCSHRYQLTFHNVGSEMRADRMSALITPPIRRTLIAVSFDCPPTTTPKGFVLGAQACSYPVNNRTLIIVRYATTPIRIFQLKVVLMTAHTVKFWRWRQL